MAPLSTLDIYVGLAAIVVAASAIYLFIRASSSSKTEQEPLRSEEDDYIKSLLVEPRGSGSRFSFPTTERYLKKSEVNRAESKIRTLTLQSELLSIVLKRLFEAEDDGEISREERVSLSRGYENDLKRINEELKRAELVVTLHELETIREDILQKFESTLNSTQSRIDTILKELKIEEERPRPPKRVEPAEELEEEEEIPEEEKPRAKKPKSDVEERLEQLRSEVLKELEELDRLELEA
ncbi:MAG: hypothetical protein PVH79_01410 [Candidatus Bathyarchaeota archaeon]|jgi:hypothetical protein